jgi:GAF domain-containing protein
MPMPRRKRSRLGKITAGATPPSQQGWSGGLGMSISVADVRRAMAELGELRFGTTAIDDAMDQIVRTTHAIFDVDGAGLMLVDSEQQLRSVAVSDDRFRDLEDLQISHDEGPCMAAFEDKELVCVEDLQDEARWPLFGPAALERGVRAVLASPIPYNQHAIGVVGVISQDRRPWSPEGELALLAFTDLAALLIASMLHAEQQTELARGLQGALDSRAVIEQAKGVLMAEQGIASRPAFQRLRDRARSERRKLSEVAAEIVAGASGGR